MQRRRRMMMGAGLLLLLGMLVCSCGSTAPDALAYQTYPFTVTGEVTGDAACGEEGCLLTMKMIAPMTAELSFEKPESLQGYLFSMNKEGITLSYGEISVPYKAAGIPGGTTLLPRMFSLDNSMQTASKRMELNSTPVQATTYETPEGDTVTVYISEADGMPLRLEGSPADGGEAIVFTVRSFRTDTETSGETS